MDLISVTPNLALDIKRNEIIDKIISRLSELKLTDMKYKNSADILLLTCNLVEHLTRDKKLSKKDMVLEIMTRVYSLFIYSRVVYMSIYSRVKKRSKKQYCKSDILCSRFCERYCHK